MQDRHHLSRMCAACGLTKSLSAFLLISGEKAGTYGQICAPCRAQGILEPTSSQEEDGFSKPVTGEKIDAKARLAAELDLERGEKQRKDLRNEYLKNRELSIQEQESEQTLEEKIKKIRIASFLDAKRNNKETARERSSSARDTVSVFAHTEGETRTIQSREQAILQQGQQENRTRTMVDTTAPFIGELQPGMIKFNNEFMQAFLRWVRTAPMATVQRQQQQATQQPQSQAQNQNQSTTTAQNENKNTEQKQNTQNSAPQTQTQNQDPNKSNTQQQPLPLPSLHEMQKAAQRQGAAPEKIAAELVSRFGFKR